MLNKLIGLPGIVDCIGVAADVGEVPKMRVLFTKIKIKLKRISLLDPGLKNKFLADMS